jgi:transposase
VFQISLPTDESSVLQEYASSAPIELMRLKAHAILLRSRSIQIKDIAFSTNRSYRTVERWIKNYSEIRLASIFSGMQGNQHAAKLTRSQKREIRKTLNKPSSKYGLPKKFWDVPQLRDYVKAEFGVVYESVQSYHYLLKFSKLSFKYPDKFNIRRDERKVIRRMGKIRKEISPLMDNSNWEVFAVDETGLLFEAVTRKAWLRKGKKTIVKVSRGKEKQNYIGFLDLKTGVCIPYRIHEGRQEYILPAVEKHIREYPKKKICIVWDNASFHKGKIIRKALEKDQSLERVHLIALPPYAPDMNPIEHVWKEGKRETANQQFKNFKTTKEVFEKKVTSRKYNYQI